ncbi:MAG: YbaB/EbfC family nucleoid-associated protein [Clostridia bacterium]|nr:YbaB/EbfC family nucleoid-associated protein [Clostridia bacterium]
MRPGRMPGGFNINEMMKQAQKLQADMEKKQAELAEREYTATAGGGAVTAVVTNGLVKTLTIAPDAIDPDDAELLADMITAAVNDALTQCKEETAREMSKLTGGVGGGLF